MPARHLAAEVTLLQIIGADRSDQIARQGGKFKVTGSTDLHKLLGKGEPRHRLHVTPNFFRQARRPDLSSYRCLLNLITEPEQNSRVLENLRKLLRDLPGKVVNRPEAVLRSTRDQVARLLAGIPALDVPRVIRLKGRKTGVAQAIERAGLNFPVIVRQAGTHTGRIVGLFESADQLPASLSKDGEHIATEFIDFRSADGFYRKYRAFFIGGKIIFRHMLASDQWSIHARDRMRFMIDKPALLDEEKALFERPEGAFPQAVLETLEAVRERMPLDYFGMDFGIGRDGRVVLFEANATMNFFPFLADPRLDHVRKCLEPAREAFHLLVGISPRSIVSSEEQLAGVR